MAKGIFPNSHFQRYSKNISMKKIYTVAYDYSIWSHFWCKNVHKMGRNARNENREQHQCRRDRRWSLDRSGRKVRRSRFNVQDIPPESAGTRLSYVRDVRQLGESGERENMLKQEPVDRSRPSKMFLQRVALLSQSSSDSFVVTPTTPRSQEAETKSWNNSWKIQAE